MHIDFKLITLTEEDDKTCDIEFEINEIIDNYYRTEFKKEYELNFQQQAIIEKFINSLNNKLGQYCCVIVED